MSISSILNLPVSIGEAFDKYSILIIKSEQIKDPLRLVEVIKELNLIKPLIESFLQKYNYLYECLYRINKEIWDLTNEVKTSPNQTIYETIFELNSFRFRVKNKLDRAVNSTLKEQKSYSATHIFVTIGGTEHNYDLFNHQIRALSLIYDTVYLKCCGSTNIQSFKDDPRIILIESIENLKPIPIETIKLPIFFTKYDFSYRPPKVYLMGGRLGDLIHLLYIIYLNHSLTGVKGLLYITNDLNLGGDTFTNFDSTYNELYSLVKSQPYIENFSKYTGESIHINLNTFRYNQYIFHDNWLTFLTKHFRLPLVTKPWIYLTHRDPIYENLVVIHRSTNQMRYVRDYAVVMKPIVNQNNCLFITCDMSEYNMFPFKDQVAVKLVTNLEEMFTIINSAKFFIGNQSAPLAMAYSMFKPLLAEFGDADGIFYRGSETFYPGFHSISNTDQHLNGLNKYLNL